MRNTSSSMTTPIMQSVNEILASFMHPTLKRSLVELNAVKESYILHDALYITLQMPFAWNSGLHNLQHDKEAHLKQQLNVSLVNWQLNYDIATLQPINQQPLIKRVRNIIAVSSGKGGVGKSATAINLALALSVEGARVGILDADIYGPSIPTMLGTSHKRPAMLAEQQMAPIMIHGLASNSIGYLVEDDNAMVWRGPMASKALWQLLTETAWPDLDYLVLDMPPGTGDIQLTLAQNIPLTGVIVVTTPQDIALLDAAKGIAMFNKVNIPILGIVENMSGYDCPNCGLHQPIFGQLGSEKIATKYDVEILATFPLDIRLREDLDKGQPTVVSRPSSELSQRYYQLAAKVASQLYWQNKTVPTPINIKTLF